MPIKTKRLSAHEKKWKLADEQARVKIVALIKDENPKALLLDGYEQAFVGLTHRYGQKPFPVYSYTKCIEINVKRDRMTYDEAIEWFEYNAMRSWVGKNTPIILLDNICD